MKFTLFGTKIVFIPKFNNIKWFKFWHRWEQNYKVGRLFYSELNLYAAYFERSDSIDEKNEYAQCTWNFSLLNVGNEHPIWSLIGTTGDYTTFKNNKDWYADFSISLLYFLDVQIELWRDPDDHLTLDEVLPSYDEKDIE